MKQKILEVLDKSTNNGMKAEEIISIIEQAIEKATQASMEYSGDEQWALDEFSKELRGGYDNEE